MSEAWAGGSTRAWRKIRREVLARDRARGWKCRAHQDGWCRRANTRTHSCEGFMTQVHHVRGKRHGDDPRYLVGSCVACNAAIGDPGVAVDPDNRPVSTWR